MPFPIKRNRIRLACRVAVISLVAGAGASCSSDLTRFDRSLYTDATPDYSQSQSNPYPADVDRMPTASIGGGRPVPAGDINSGVVDYRQPQGSQAYQGGQGGGNYPRQLPLSQGFPQGNAQQDGYAYGDSGSAIQRSELPPQSSSAAPARRIDPVRTSAISPDRDYSPRETERMSAAQPAQERPVASGKPAAAGSEGKGWTSTGGTAITMREGETLYNLSKRYGVPVSAIVKANNLSDPSVVKAGSTVIIPTYVYSRSAPVSAPDNDAGTRTASADRGSLVVPARAPTPVQAARGQAIPDRAASPDRTASKVEPRQEEVAGTVRVASGDTLAAIARQQGVSISAIKSANNLNSDTIRIGQVLKMPAGAPHSPAAADPAVTASVRSEKPEAGPRPYVKPQSQPATEQTAAKDDAAPAQTGIGEFRWPVRGRVISAFGDKTAAGRNDGIDISVPEGTAVKAAENGVVVYAGDELAGFGNLVLVRHSDGWVSAYGYNQKIDVQRGDEVRRGQTIARSGRTGDADMPKLHFELRKGSTPVDPIKQLGEG